MHYRIQQIAEGKFDTQIYTMYEEIRPCNTSARKYQFPNQIQCDILQTTPANSHGQKVVQKSARNHRNYWRNHNNTKTGCHKMSSLLELPRMQYMTVLKIFIMKAGSSRESSFAGGLQLTDQIWNKCQATTAKHNSQAVPANLPRKKICEAVFWQDVGNRGTATERLHMARGLTHGQGIEEV